LESFGARLLLNYSKGKSYKSSFEDKGQRGFLLHKNLFSLLFLYFIAVGWIDHKSPINPLPLSFTIASIIYDNEIIDSKQHKAKVKVDLKFMNVVIKIIILKAISGKKDIIAIASIKLINT
jgi:hypothetical protein